MELILIEHIKGLGKAGNVVRAKRGYARNYLIPYNKAIRATKEALADLEKRKEEIAMKAEKKLQEIKDFASAIAKTHVYLIRKVGNDNKIFGSAKPRDVAQALENQGYEVNYKHIKIKDVIKSPGVYPVNIELHSEVSVSIKLYVASSEEAAEEMHSKELEREKAQAIQDNDVESMENAEELSISEDNSDEQSQT